MKTVLITLVPAFLAGILLSWRYFRLLLRYSCTLGLVDIPNQRKLHHVPIPVIGGLGVYLSIATAAFFIPSFRSWINEFAIVAIAATVLLITGVLDDRLTVRPFLRMLIQAGCALAIARSGYRIYSLYGLFGIHEIALPFQYLLTVLVITGITNAFNLIDGLDGLAGSLALVNSLSMLVLFQFIGDSHWTGLLAILVGVLLVFLRFNWRPARLFMGDGGSLLLGLLLAVTGIMLINSARVQESHWQKPIFAVVSALFMIPVIDTLRVFFVRIKIGRSPFSADKNHLHHWLIRQYQVHSRATLQILAVHVSLIIASWFLCRVTSLTVVLLFQLLVVTGYTGWLQLNGRFSRWYRYVRKMEAAS